MTWQQAGESSSATRAVSSHPALRFYESGTRFLRILYQNPLPCQEVRPFTCSGQGGHPGGGASQVRTGEKVSLSGNSICEGLRAEELANSRKGCWGPASKGMSCLKAHRSHFGHGGCWAGPGAAPGGGGTKRAWCSCSPLIPLLPPRGPGPGLGASSPRPQPLLPVSLTVSLAGGS